MENTWCKDTQTCEKLKVNALHQQRDRRAGCEGRAVLRNTRQNRLEQTGADTAGIRATLDSAGTDRAGCDFMVQDRIALHL